MPTSIIAIVSISPRVSFADAQIMATAVHSQVRLHLSTAWQRDPFAVVAYPDQASVPKGMPTIRFVPKDLDEPNALGWHTEDAAGNIFGDVLVDPVLDNGGTLFEGDNSLSAVLSHEICETFCDRSVTTWDQMPDGALVAHEVSDPVEGDSYAILVNQKPVSVSNFVFPEWFDANIAPGTRLDQMGKLIRPFTMSPGGYLVIMRPGLSDGKKIWDVTSVFGARFPEWKKLAKQAKTARLFRRTKSAKRIAQ